MRSWFAVIWLGCSTPSVDASEPRVTTVDPPRAVEAWSLARTDGSTFSEAELLGRTTVVAVGTTRSPSSQRILPVLQQVAQARPELQVLFLTVDPRDDAKSVDDALASGAPSVRGLVGQPSELARAMASLGTSWAPSTTEAGAIDHSTSLVVVDETARVRGYLHRPADAARVLTDLSAL